MNRPAHRLGLVSDHTFFLHLQPGHPERPERLQAIAHELDRTGLLGETTPVAAREVTRDELLRVHTAAHIDLVAAATGGAPGFLDADTYHNEHTWAAATRGAGGTIDLALQVACGELDRGLALVRPPGHHATPSATMGFCIFNHVALAARAVQAGTDRQRVAIVDFDVHHGNGTQDIFYDDPSVLFISMHQYPLWPGTGVLTETGAGAAAGANLNIPLPPGTGDAGLRAATTRLVLPALQRFKPDMLLISGGWDGHWRDPLAQLQYSLSGLAWLGRTLVQAADDLCAGRLVLALEGGYDAEVLALGVANAARSLLGREAQEDPLGHGLEGETDATGALDVIERHVDRHP